MDCMRTVTPHGCGKITVPALVDSGASVSVTSTDSHRMPNSGILDNICLTAANGLPLENSRSDCIDICMSGKTPMTEHLSLVIRFHYCPQSQYPFIIAERDLLRMGYTISAGWFNQVVTRRIGPAPGSGLNGVIYCLYSKLTHQNFVLLHFGEVVADNKPLVQQPIEVHPMWHASSDDTKYAPNVSPISASAGNSTVFFSDNNPTTSNEGHLSSALMQMSTTVVDSGCTFCL